MVGAERNNRFCKIESFIFHFSEWQLVWSTIYIISTFEDPPFDFSIFVQQSAQPLDRLEVALEYYSRLDVQTNKEDQDKFKAFVHEIYSNHFIIYHGNNLSDISERFRGNEVCAMKDCPITQRHFASSNAEPIGDPTLNFYVQTLDSLYFWANRSFDAGYRVKTANHQQKEQTDDELFDQEFNRLNNEIRARSHLTNAFERISTQNNSKYSLSIQTNDDNTTFLDQMHGYLIDGGVVTKVLQKLTLFLKSEAFGTDSVKMDLALGNGNISDEVKDGECIRSIIQFVKVTAGSTHFFLLMCLYILFYINSAKTATFSLGYRFYYWEWYSKREELPANEQMIEYADNKHDHSGHKVCELYIEPKYASFKEEAVNYPNLNISQYAEACTKATKYMQTKTVKQLTAKATHPALGDMFLHYDINIDDALQFHHILALIFYCDFSKLCTHFSSAFRKLNPFETLKSIKQRNAKYYWMSQRLRELVELFGQCSRGDTFQKYPMDYEIEYDRGKDDRSKPLDALRGPYFCGMSFECNVPAFAMRLNSPTSTSKQIEVAIKFSGPSGVLFTFDNPSDNAQYKFLRGFNCSWVSRFMEEDERLFFGGFFPIKVMNLRLIKTKQNFKKFVAAIFYFDLLFNGANLAGINANKNYFLYLDNLIKHNSKLPPFISNCFESFKRTKKHIAFDMDDLNCHVDKKIVNLLFHSFDQRDTREVKETKRGDDDLSNLARADILKFFPNAKTLTISSKHWMSSYSFSLMSFLDITCQTNLEQIIIKSEQYPLKNKTWIQIVWEMDEQLLKKEFAAKNYQIEMKTYQDIDDGLSLVQYNLHVNKI